MDWRITMHANGFLKIFRNNTYVSIPGKLSEINLYAWLFSNPCGKVLIIVGISLSPDLTVYHTLLSFLQQGSLLASQWNLQEKTDTIKILQISIFEKLRKSPKCPILNRM